MGYKMGEADKVIAALEQQYDLRKAAKDSMDLPAHEPIQLFGRFATPEHFNSDNDDVVTRENTTGNISENIYKRVTTQGTIRSTFIWMLKNEFPDDRNIATVINMIGSDITTEMSNSKSINGLLLNLVVSSKRMVDVTSGMVKDGAKKVFGLR